MKKLLLLLSLIIITSCSSSDDDQYIEKNYFNPPAWCYGVWTNETGIKLTISRNNIIVKSSETTLSFNDSANDLNRNGGYVNVSESTSPNNYSFVFRFGEKFAEKTITMKIIKISDREIKLEEFLDGAVFKK